jgi:hypothetical protein
VVFDFKACPRDRGDLYISNDQYGKFKQCMQCGYVEDIISEKIDGSRKNNLGNDQLIKMDQYMQIAQVMCNSDSPLTISQILSGVSSTKDKAINGLNDLINIDYVEMDISGKYNKFYAQPPLNKSLNEYNQLMEFIIRLPDKILSSADFSLFLNIGKLTELGNLVMENHQKLPNLSTLVNLISENRGIGRTLGKN